MSAFIKATRFFDGQEIMGSVAIETKQDQIVGIAPLDPMLGGPNHDVEFLAPRFYDWSLRLRGYRRRMSELPYTYLEYFIKLLGHYGVFGGLDVGNTWERIAVARDMLGIREMVWGGPLLTSTTPLHETELFVQDSRMVRNAVEYAALQGAGMIALGQTFAPELAERAIGEAKERGLLVLAVPGRTSPVRLLNLGVDLLLGAHNLGFEMVDWEESRLSPLDLAKCWAGVSVGELVDLLAGGFDTNPAGVITEMIAFRRLVFVREAVHSASLELLKPILPDTAWLVEMRSSAGYLIGKKKLFEATGLKALSRSERIVAERGMENLAQTVIAIAGLTRILPGSRAASLSVVPGWGLLEELNCLRQLGFATEKLLRSVTSEAIQLLGVGDGRERIKVGQPVSFVASRVPFDGSAESFLNLRGFEPEQDRG